MSHLWNIDLFTMVISFIISLSVFSLFLAIILDFSYYNRTYEVKKEKRSIVETGTMTMFFVIYYIALNSKIGVIGIKDSIENLYFIRVLIVIGTVMVGAGCIINIIGRFNLGRNWANHIKIYEEHKLIQTGMYDLVRHPLYSSIMAMLYGGVLVYRNILCFALVTFVFIPFMYYRAKQEESLLEIAFPEYESYKNKTGMFFPKIKKGR